MSHKPNKQTVSELQFNVSQLLKQPTGATRLYSIHLKTARSLDDDITFVSPLRGEVKFLRTGADILVIGNLEGRVRKSCPRCLNDFTTPLTVELEEMFYPIFDITTGHPLSPPPDADEANGIDELHTLDLFEVTRQALLLESSSIQYCRPNCKGLCPYCGQDRNVIACTCQDEARDVRWAGLQTMQLEE